MTVHTTLPDGIVIVGASATVTDLTAAITAAGKATKRTLRIHAVNTIDDLHRIAAVAAGYGWQPTLSFPASYGSVDIIDMHLGGGL